ncbi:MAG: glycosyltransferase family 39 protein, partial [Candidatus Dormibacteraeota bacterium]|nr:glycosyltransferase family 39 protein [Candidatus Dormibacteraeota bacterium]
MFSPAPTEAAAEARPVAHPAPFAIDAGSWALAAVTVLAAVLRLATLSDQSYWLDESQAVHEMHLSFGAMLSAWSRFEWNPPLYLLVAWPWAKLFGTGEVGLRLLSALLGIGLVPLIYMCGRELVSRPAGLVAAAFAAVNPFMIWYSVEAREYMLLVVLCAASLLFFARAWRTRGRRDLAWWTVLSILALLTQYYAGFLVAAESLALVYRCRSRISLLALGAVGVAELALVPHVVPRLSHPVQFIVSLPLSLRLQQVPVTFAMNTLYQSSLVSSGLIGAAVVAAAALGLLVAGAGRRELRGVGLAAGLAAAVLLVPLA